MRLTRCQGQARVCNSYIKLMYNLGAAQQLYVQGWFCNDDNLPYNHYVPVCLYALDDTSKNIVNYSIVQINEINKSCYKANNASETIQEQVQKREKS